MISVHALLTAHLEAMAADSKVLCSELLGLRFEVVHCFGNETKHGYRDMGFSISDSSTSSGVLHRPHDLLRILHVVDLGVDFLANCHPGSTLTSLPTRHGSNLT